jgi:hypothetical protein
MHSRCISCHDRPSVRTFVCSFFAFRHDRNERDTIFSSPVPAARSFFVFGFRNFSSEISGPDKSRPRYRRCRETTGERNDEKRGETNKARLSVFDSFRLSAGLKATSVKGHSAASPLTKRAKQPFSFSFLSLSLSARENLRDSPLRSEGDIRWILLRPPVRNHDSEIQRLKLFKVALRKKSRIPDFTFRSYILDFTYFTFYFLTAPLERDWSCCNRRVSSTNFFSE